MDNTGKNLVWWSTNIIKETDVRWKWVFLFFFLFWNDTGVILELNLWCGEEINWLLDELLCSICICLYGSSFLTQNHGKISHQSFASLICRFQFASIFAAPAEVCNDLMAYSLILSCCCYTCCIRRKLRKTLNIKVNSVVLDYYNRN